MVAMMAYCLVDNLVDEMVALMVDGTVDLKECMSGDELDDLLAARSVALMVVYWAESMVE